MADYSLFQELRARIGLDAEGVRLLREVQPFCSPQLGRAVDRFYAVLTSSASMRSVFQDEAQIDRQKVHLRGWLEDLFRGPFGEAYFEQRARIGRVHVRIGLAQHHMFSMMNVLRRELMRVLREGTAEAGWPEAQRHEVEDALHGLLDLELAVMLETYRESYSEALGKTERLAALGQLAGSVGHELRNPLAVIDTSLHLARRGAEDPKLSRHLDKIERQVRISEQIITDLLELARERPPQRAPVLLTQLVEEGLGGVDTKDVPLRRNVTEGTVRVDASQLRQVLVNLVQNASQAIRDMVAGPAREIRVAASAPAGALHIEVEDDGPGFDAEVQARLFEPLFTTRAQGIGLGLSLCRRIVEAHGGTLRAERVASGGARFVLDIPA